MTILAAGQSLLKMQYGRVITYPFKEPPVSRDTKSHFCLVNLDVRITLEKGDKVGIGSGVEYNLALTSFRSYFNFQKRERKMETYKTTTVHFPRMRCEI
jgi:hypothetical protein